ncbi:MAG TPA: hypothetical protein VEL07_15105 [Planctomycetota bacterium]|nr:hypothetical protein [Planctomycetota bacterium]
MRIRLSPSDAFHWLLDGAIRRGGGPGTSAQLRLRLARPVVDRAALANAWRRLGERAWMLAATPSINALRAYWRVRGPAALRVAFVDDARLDALALAELARGFPAAGGEHARLSCAGDPAEPGIVLTWSHRLFDARGALALVNALAAGGRIDDPWWKPGYRDAMAHQPAAQRGREARRSLDFVKPLRRTVVLTPLTHAAPAAPLIWHGEGLGDATAACDARLRQAAGRFGETPFLLACVAATLEEVFGERGDCVFPLAVDARTPGQARRLANAHGFLLLRCPMGLASADLGRAARHLRDDHRRWVAEEGVAALDAALSWTTVVGPRLAHAELGGGRSGVTASCLVANVGRADPPATLFGSELLGVDHAAAVPGRPGLAVLFHRDRRGLGFAVVATAAVARRIAPADFARRMRHHLTERAFTSVA